MKTVFIKIAHDAMDALTVTPDGQEFLDSLEVNYKILGYYNEWALVDAYQCDKGVVDVALGSYPEGFDVIGEFEHGTDINKPAEILSINEAELLTFMPDVVVYDSEGVETSRTRPVKARVFHDWCDLSKRRLLW